MQDTCNLYSAGANSPRKGSATNSQQAQIFAIGRSTQQIPWTAIQKTRIYQIPPLQTRKQSRTRNRVLSTPVGKVAVDDVECRTRALSPQAKRSGQLPVYGKSFVSSVVESNDRHVWTTPESPGGALGLCDFKKVGKSRAKPTLLSVQLAGGSLSQKRTKLNMDLSTKKTRASPARKKQKHEALGTARSPPDAESAQHKFAPSNQQASVSAPEAYRQPTPLAIPRSEDSTPLDMRYLKMIFTSLRTINLVQQASDQLEIRKIAMSIDLPTNLDYT